MNAVSFLQSESVESPRSVHSQSEASTVVVAVTLDHRVNIHATLNVNKNDTSRTNALINKQKIHLMTKFVNEILVLMELKHI